MHHYILDEKGNPVVADLDTWCKWIKKAERHVADENIGPYRISTVFLGLDHNYTNHGPPILWESMVFKKQTPGKKWTRKDFGDLEMDRCSGSREQAEAMHGGMVELVKKKYKAKP